MRYNGINFEHLSLQVPIATDVVYIVCKSTKLDFLLSLG